MAWYWIVLLVLTALLVLLCLTRVGVLAEFDAKGLRLDAKIGLFSIHILPAKHKEKREKKPKKERKTPDPEKPKWKPTLADIKELVSLLWPPLLRALNRTRKGIRVHPLTLSLTVGAAEDPAAGAELYGYLHGGVWTGMPLLEQVLVIPDPRIHIGIDFDTSKMETEGKAGVSLRIGTLLAVGLSLVIPALRALLRIQKKQKQAAKSVADGNTPERKETRDGE